MAPGRDRCIPQPVVCRSFQQSSADRSATGSLTRVVHPGQAEVNGSRESGRQRGEVLAVTDGETATHAGALDLSVRTRG